MNDFQANQKALCFANQLLAKFSIFQVLCSKSSNLKPACLTICAQVAQLISPWTVSLSRIFHQSHFPPERKFLLFSLFLLAAACLLFLSFSFLFFSSSCSFFQNWLFFTKSFNLASSLAKIHAIISGSVLS